MKRILLISLCILATLSSVARNKIIHEEWDGFAGPKVGAAYNNFSKIWGDWTIAPVVGGFFEVHLTRQFALGMDIYWTMNGTKNVPANGVGYRTGVTETGDPIYTPIGDYDVTIGTVYTNFIGKYYLTPRLGVFTGLNFGTNTNSKVKTQNVGVLKGNALFAGSDFSIPVGVTYLLSNKLSVEARFNFGLKKMSERKNMTGGEYFLKDGGSRQVMLTASYRIPIL